jgi:hypothetical protein
MAYPLRVVVQVPLLVEGRGPWKARILSFFFSSANQCVAELEARSLAARAEQPASHLRPRKSLLKGKVLIACYGYNEVCVIQKRPWGYVVMGHGPLHDS